MPNASSPELIATVCESAAAAFPAYAELPSARRAEFLNQIAANLEANAETILATASRETHLPATPRLSGELARTCAQFRMFADLIQTEAWRDERLVPGDPTRTPIPKPELRRTQIPLGPVAVFGASNFPLAYSVPGGDTASALAAGCPVVVKAHPAHPETSQRCADAIREAAAATNMPEGVFGIVWGDVEAAIELVTNPHIEAVGFTGSLRAGRALYNACAARPMPIPVYAEMGSINPVFLLPGALAARGDAIAQGYAESVTASMGQFCTNPGVVLGIAGSDFDQFLDLATKTSVGKAGAAMLTEGITAAFARGNAERKGQPGVATLSDGAEGTATIFRVDAATFLANVTLHEEIFGPSAIAVSCSSLDEMFAVARAFEGQLTATVHFESIDRDDVRILLPLLSRFAGRVIANGFPTGVEVNAAQTHGGPYPATTDVRSTSVGTAAILRFVRPITYQNVPPELLSPPL